MRRALCIAPALLLTACGGGGGGSPALPPAHGSPAAKNVTVTAKITIPGSASTTNRALKHIYDTASTTQGVLLTVYPASGGSPSQPVTVTGGDISGDAASNCTTTGSGRTCYVSFAAPPGNSNALLAQTYTQIIPSGGTVPGGAQLLGAGTTSLSIVAASGLNSVGLTLNPVLASVNIAPVPTTLRTLIPATFGVIVTGLDAAGNIIVAGQYVDQNANPVSATLALGTNPNSSLVLSPTTVGSPGTVVTGTYHGNANVTNATSVAITSAAPFSTSATMTIVPPTVVAYSLAALNPVPTTYMGIDSVNAGGSDPQIWFMTAGSPGGIETYDIASKALSFFPAQASNQMDGGMAYDATDSAEIIGGAQTLYDAAPSPAPTLTNPVSFAYCTSCAGWNATTSGIATYNGTAYYLQGGLLLAYNYAGQTAGTTGASCSSGCPSANFRGVRADGSGNIYLADFEANGAVWEYSGGALTPTATFPTGFNDVAYSPTDGIFATNPGANFIDGFASPIVNGEDAGEGIPTTGAPQYLIFDSTNSNQIWYDETASGGGVILGRDQTQTGPPAEITIGAAGGVAGPIVQFPGGTAIGIVHFTSSGNGEFLVVYP